MELQKQNADAEKIFYLLPEFKAWIESTSLFHALKTDLGSTIRLHDEQTMEIVGEIARNGTPINKVEDLPIPMIQDFYFHSPFFDDNINPILKLLP